MNTQKILDQLVKFRSDRGWQKYHTPEELARAIMIEGAELNRNFLWGPEYQKPDVENVKEELADIMIYCLYMAEGYNINIESAVLDKIKKNEIKYPV